VSVGEMAVALKKSVFGYSAFCIEFYGPGFFTAINATYGSIFIGIKPAQSYGFFKPFIIELSLSC
jgi:hypothetical protein